MKKYLFVIIFLMCATRANVFAQTTLTPNDVQEAKDKIASQVAEIKNPKSIVRGKVESIDSSNKTFVLAALNKKYSVKYLQKTVYFWIKNDGAKLSLNFASLEVKDEVAVIGELSPIENQINADTIYGKNFLKLVAAKISRVNAAAKTIDVKTLSAETEYNIDLANVAADLKSIKNHSESSLMIADLKPGQVIVVKGQLKDPQKNNLTARSFFLIQN